jgi:hypothetical protein
MRSRTKLSHPAEIERRRKEAKIRKDYRALLDTDQQIKALDARLGIKIGAVRERKRLSIV